jgi:hypothetical protein
MERFTKRRWTDKQLLRSALNTDKLNVESYTYLERSWAVSGTVRVRGGHALRGNVVEVM